MKPTAGEPLKLSYWIDSTGTILRLDGPWQRWLAKDGELPDSCREANVVGNSLFSFIEGEGVRHVYDTMILRVLETGRTIEFPFRCDSPWLRREMQMRISPDGGVVRYDSMLLNEIRRRRPLPQPTPSTDILVAMCSFCKAYRFPIESRLWKGIESLFMVLELPDHFSVTHGICDRCLDLCLREL
jgi:hypothetical protein